MFKEPDEILALLTGEKKRITRQLSVLAVDDAVFNLSALRNILKKDEYVVNVATSGKDALDALSQTLVDVAVLDIQMPEMSGIELYEKMLADPVSKSIPVVFVTADNDSDTVTKALEMGASGYVVKPYSESILLSKVKIAVETAKIDQGKLYLLKRIRAIRELIKNGNVKGAVERFDEVPVDIFKPVLVIMLNRLQMYLSRLDNLNAVKISDSIISELENVEKNDGGGEVFPLPHVLPKKDLQ